MAKGTTIGFLNFGIDGDNKELLKKLEQAKKEAKSIEEIFKNIKLNIGGKVLSPDVQKAQIAADKLSISNNKVAKSAAEMALAETKSANQVLMDTQKLIYEKEKLAGLQKRNSLIGVQGQKDLAAAYGLTNKTMFNQKNLLQQLSSAAGIYLSIYQAGSFVKELAKVSGEFEKQRVTLTAIIGDAEAANRIFNQIKDLAVISPFNFKELTDYAKQLSAFSIPTNEIFDTTKRLADLSAGLGVDMSRIILAYGQVRSAAVLRGQELRQFTEAGIPLVDELAKKFGELSGEIVSAGEVFDKISNRQVPFEMIKEIITDLTSEGGKFFEMQELQSATLAGKISNLRDNYDMMLDSIGRANKGLLHGALDGLVGVMDNWEKYWKILKSIIVAYGTYKAVLITVSAIQKVSVTLETISRFVSLTRAITGASAATASLAAASRTLGLASLTNPITAIATLFGVLASAVILFKKEAKSADEVLGDLESTTEKYLKVIDDSQNKLVRLTKTYTELKDNTNRNEQEQRKFEKVIQDIIKIVPNASDEIDRYGKTLSINIEKVRAFNEETREFARQAAGNEIVQAQQKIDELTKRQKFITNILNDDKRSGNIYLPEKDRMRLENERFENSLKINELIEKRAKSQSILNGLGKEIDLIAQKYAALAEEIDKTPITNGFNKDQAKADNTVKMLNEMLEVYKRWGQNDLAKDIEKQIETIKKNGEGWRKELQDILGKTITINTESNINDVIDEIKKKYKELADTVKEQAEILKNANFNFDTNSFNFPANNAVRQIAESYNANKSDLDSLGKALQYIGMTIASVLGGANGSSSKDELAEKLKKRINLLKEVRKEYDKLVKAGKSSDEAATYLMGLDSFKGIDARNYEQEIQKIIDDLRKKGQLSEKQRSLLESLILGKDKDKIIKEVEEITKESKTAFDKIEKELSKYKDDYGFYKKILGITGDKEQAGLLAFGDISKDVQDYIIKLKEAFRQVSGIRFSDFINLDDVGKEKILLKKGVKELYDQIRNEEKNESERRRNIYAESLRDYSDLLDKQSAIREKYRERIDIATENNNPALVSKLQSAMESDLMKLTPEYQKFFTSIYSLTQDEAISIGNLIKTNLKEQLDKGVISTQDYYEGIKRIDEELEKSKKGIDYFGKLQSGGVDNLFKALNEKASSDYQSALIDLKKYQDEYNQAVKIGDEKAADLAQNNIKGAEGIMQGAKNMQGFASAAQGVVGAVDRIVVAIDQSVRATQQLVDQFAELAESRGIDTDSGKWADIKRLMNTMSEVNAKAKASWDSAKGGDPAGALANAVGIVTSGLSAINAWHDKKLNKAIEKSVFEVKKLQNAYTDLQRTIERQLGAVSETQAKDMISNLEKQRSELQSQLANEQKKKKSDKNAIEDYKSQIKELDKQIRYFYEDLAGEQWGISIKDWAGQISSALVDAFASGEDAATAFDKSVADIMKNVIKNMIQLAVIEPAMERLRTKLFGGDGKGGLLGEGTTDLSQQDAATIVNELAGLRDKISESKDIWNYLNEAAEKAGIHLEDVTSKDTLSKGIQAVTEDTASILASYMNAMRADLAAQKQFVRQLVSLAQLHTDQFANMYAELLRIQVNTLATANNTAQNVELVAEIRDIMKKVTLPNSGTAINLA